MHINIPKYLPHCSVVISVIWLEDGWHGQNSEGTPRYMARPLKAWAGNWRTVTSTTFRWPKQVTRLVQIKEKGKKLHLPTVGRWGMWVGRYKVTVAKVHG